MIEVDEYALTEHVPTSPVGRRRPGDTAVIWVGTSRLAGKVTYVDRVRDWAMVWVRVPMIDVPLPAYLT